MALVPDRRGAGTIVDRQSECRAIDELIADVVNGRSRTIILRGEPGVGKSVLLGYMTTRAAGCRVARAAGVESEMELAYSGLHQLCAPLLDHLDRLPAPQRDALAVLFGLSHGTTPDRFLVGLATLSLLADVADRQPLVCIIDDAHWLDQASTQTLGFVARRLAAERVAIVGAARTGIGDNVLVELPGWHVEGLGDSDALTLLLGSARSPLDAAVCAQIVAESRGNPLALLELPRTWDDANLAGGYGLPGHTSITTKIEKSYQVRLAALPAATQTLVLAAAAEPLGDLTLLTRTIELLGVDIDAAGPALDGGLLHIDQRVTFAHPLVRSVAYGAASAGERRRVHQALASVTDSATDPDRRAWHRARATVGYDEAVAAELERSASRAQARGGVAAAAAFLRRATALTADPSRRAGRALAAAQASYQAGAFETALELLDVSDVGPLDGSRTALVALTRAQIAFTSGLGRDAPPLLLRAAQQLERFDPELARETYLNAWVSATIAGQEARAHVVAVSRAILALPPRDGGPTNLDRLLRCVALLSTRGHAGAAESMRSAVRAFAALSPSEVLRWGWHASTVSDALWDNEATRTITERTSRMLREAGAHALLSFPLTALGNAAMRSGDFATASLHIAEAEAIAAATGTRFAPYTALRVRALQGREREASDLITLALERARAEGQGLAGETAHYAAAILYNGLGRYDEAMASARRSIAMSAGMFLVSSWVLPELIEAAVRTGDVRLARGAHQRLQGRTVPCGTDWALGIEARCRALVEIGSTEELYREAIDRLARAGLRPELARSHLVYGEWLRREGRRVDARHQLRAAFDLCTEIGMAAFGERARRELVATGEKVRQRSDHAPGDLTPQEEQIARLARDGLTNAQIGATLFLSPRTVEWHLRKVFTKLGIASRNGLHAALTDGAAGDGSRPTTP